MIKVGVVVTYIGLNQKWSVAKVKATSYHIVLDKNSLPVSVEILSVMF